MQQKIVIIIQTIFCFVLGNLEQNGKLINFINILLIDEKIGESLFGSQKRI